MHTLRDGHPSYAWDRDEPPAMTVAPGAVVELQLRDASDGQLGRTSVADDVAGLDPDRANPLTGPVAVDGAEPGDTLVVHVEAVDTADWGWTAVIPDFGLLSDDFPAPYLTLSRLAGDTVEFGSTGITIPRRPFIGTIGVAPAAPGRHGTIPPLPTGGNLDCRDVRPGATLRLPVAVPGALLSAGDAHAAQGDGEVCGTAVETSATVRLRLDLERGPGSALPHLSVPAETAPAGARHATLGVADDLMVATRDATRAMVEWLTATHGLTPVDAYQLCSVIGDLRIREVVDAPNWVVSLDVPLAVLAPADR